jgi:hypothetical protein
LGWGGGDGIASLFGIELLAARMLSETITVALDVDDPGVMQEPVDDG